MAIQGSSSSAPPEAAASAVLRARLTVAIVFIAVLVTNLDLFVVNIALPRVGDDFHGASLSALSWVLNAYAIVFASLLVVFGRLAGRGGQRGGFLLGLVVFTVGSALCAVATNTGFLVGARVLQAVGAAVLVPTSLALLLVNTPTERRAVMLRAWSVAGGVAATISPVVGGLLAQVGWRWVFIINLPLGVVAFIVGMRTLPEVRDTERGKLPDVFGAVLLAGSIGALALGLVQVSSWGWGSARTVGTFAAAIVLLAGFLISSARHPSPVVELPVLRLRALNAPAAGLLLYSAGFAAMVLSCAEWTQNVWGYSALKSGLALVPGVLMVPPFFRISGILSKRIGPGAVAALGNLFFVVGLLVWALRITVAADYAAAMLPGAVMVGIGIGLALPTLVATGAFSLPLERAATSSGVINMSRQIGAVIGVAVLVVTLGKPVGTDATHTAFRHGWYAIMVIGLLAAAASLRIGGSFKPSRSQRTATPAGQGQADVEVSAAS
ncbi:MAG TPA: MFS transporter [Actinocrinis sp.]|uniref:MFS transporter n=1 Tax=Actinocrinis sp. TaxID=1920516 RepID=UPI002DDCB75C|nr:MFS transporter [Actinocrinis sp.]HEV2343153.1 MFS transporter [Actinocrinis sp.]